MGYSFPPNPPAGMIRSEGHAMNGLNDAYVESAIKEARDGRLWALVETEKRQREPKPKPVGRPKLVPGPNHPWRRARSKSQERVETSYPIMTFLSD